MRERGLLNMNDPESEINRRVEIRNVTPNPLLVRVEDEG